MFLLAGDIGGTNSRLICAEISDSGRHILAEKNYLSAEHSGLVEIIDIFLSTHDITTAIDAACFAVAGPVEFGIASVTNLPWIISEQELSKQLHSPRVKLINDFVAAAYGLSELKESDMLVLQNAKACEGELLNPDAAIIGAGTGLGAAHLVWLNDHYQVYPSEAGHAGFAPENELQCELLAWMQSKHLHVSVEMLLSGSGLINIYQFLHQVKGIAETPAINHAMKKSDPAKVITDSALADEDDLCQKTLDCFIDIYAAAASNIALHYYPIGQLYIAGGIAPKIRSKISEQGFIDTFRNKGLMSSNMEKITIKLICQNKVGLYGALSLAQYASH